MSEPIETHEYEGKRIDIVSDENPEDPRDEYTLGTMVCAHGRYNLGDVQIGRRSKRNPDIFFGSIYDFEDYLEKNKKSIVALPLYMFEHSGILLNTTGFSDPWDSGLVGHIYSTYETIREAYGLTRISKVTRKRVEKALKYEVEIYGRYLNGEAYGFKIFDENGEMIDSCYGFYSTEDALEAAKESI